MSLPPIEAAPNEAIYLDVIREARDRGIQFALGGGYAVTAYTHHLQRTNDIDLYVLPDDRERMIAILTERGLKDYHSVEAYDRESSYRAHLGGLVVDVIWAMENRRASVDIHWVTRGTEFELHGETVRVLPPEELIWSKLYVLQHDRCDWGDILNLIDATFDSIDWDHLVARLGNDAPLLAAVLTLYGWLCPEQEPKLPVAVDILARPASRRDEPIPREQLLDRRPWWRG